MVRILANCAIAITAVLLACYANFTFSWTITAGATGLYAFQRTGGAAEVRAIYADCVLHRNPDGTIWEQGIPCTARTIYWLLGSGVAAFGAAAIVDAIRNRLGT